MLGISKLPQVSERRMQVIRWVLTVAWLVTIGSLFWDPISVFLTGPNNGLSPFPFDPNQCIVVQGNCLTQKPQSLGLIVFWTLVVPSSILILLIFGHETWRRICPLSFLSQIPRALGIQRKRKIVKAGTTRYELVKVKKDSWLGKNHLYVQFGLLTLGLVARLLLINSDRIALGIFLLLTIASAMVVGYLYEGKSWCQYFCPMAPVQMVFNGPRGLLGTEAHQGQKQTVTQSMCRSVDKEGNVKSACVGCQSPCIDIDAERTYWETFSKPGRKFVHYGYLGLVIGFFGYYCLYAGNFDYLFSGAWLREENQAATLFNPGFYLAGQALPIPKLVAAPLTLLVFIGLTYIVLLAAEKAYKNYLKQWQKTVTAQQVAHIVFSVCTFVAFNLFFAFSSRSLLAAFPLAIQLFVNGFLVLVSTLWLSRTLDRSAERYSRESLAGSLRRQLSKLSINFSRFLEGRSMDDLKPEEVYVLAKVLPGANQEQSLQLYKGVLREALEQGNADSASSLEVLRPIRQELNIKDEDHFTVLTELGAAEPELLDPKKRRTRESQLRIESFQQALSSMLLDLVDSGMSLQEAMERQRKQIQFLKLEYGMTTEEEEQVLSQLLAGEQGTILRKAETLLEQLQQLADRNTVLSRKELDHHPAVFKFLRLTAVQHKQQILTKQMLGLLELLGSSSEALHLATATRDLAAQILPDLLQTSEGSLTWKQRLQPEVMAVLEDTLATGDRLAAELQSLTTQVAEAEEGILPEVPVGKPASPSTMDVLHQLLQELDPLIQALALYGLNLLNPQRAREQAQPLLKGGNKGHWLVQETAQSLTVHNPQAALNEVQTLIAQVTLMQKTEQQLWQQPVVRVGRSPANDIVLAHPQVAPHHAIFYLDGDEFSVLDLGTSAGLYIGNQQIQNDRVRLHQGQVIQFSPNPDPAITIYWEKQPLQTAVPAEEMITLDKVLLLFESRFFRSLKPDALIELGRDALVKVYSRGEWMCRAGDPSDSILLLIDGVADVMVQRGDSEQVVGTVNVGETIGEMGVLTRQKRSASVVAASDYCRVLVIQADSFDAVLRQDPEVARNLLVVLSVRLQSMTNKMKAVAKA